VIYLVESCVCVGPGLYKLRAGAVGWPGTWVELVQEGEIGVGFEVRLEMTNGKPLLVSNLEAVAP